MKIQLNKQSSLVEFVLNQTVLLLLIGFILVMSMVRTSFLAWWNIQSILLDVSIYGVVACGMTMLIISGEFDLSASSQYMWAQILFVTLLNVTNNPFVSIVLTLISGALLGTLNGFIVTKLRVNSFIATLGTMTMIRGLCLVFTDGKMVSTRNTFISALGGAEIFGVSSLTFIYIGVLIVVSIILGYTNFGRRLYATGGNIDVARLAGINTTFQKTDLALTCVAATVIGGTRLSGGAGNAMRTALGMLVIVVLYKALIYLGLQAYYQNLAKGLVLISVVVFDIYMTKRRAEAVGR